MNSIGLVPNWDKENTSLVVERIVNFFQSQNISLLTVDKKENAFFADVSLAEQLSTWQGKVQIIIVVGGDGTILKAARDLAFWDTPILGINVGHKGFLAEIEVEHMERYLHCITAGRYRFSERMMLEAVIKRNGEEINRLPALNDIVVSRGPFSRIINLHTYIDNEFLESYSGDGLVVSSPTGSTGYSLSAGGPVVNPNLELLVITPICPHSLNNRSIIVTGSETIRLEVGCRQAQVVLTADGQVGFALEDGDEIYVRRAAVKAKLVCFPGNSFYRLLHQKLKG